MLVPAKRFRLRFLSSVDTVKSIQLQDYLADDTCGVVASLRGGGFHVDIMPSPWAVGVVVERPSVDAGCAAWDPLPVKGVGLVLCVAAPRVRCRLEVARLHCGCWKWWQHWWDDTLSKNTLLATQWKEVLYKLQTMQCTFSRVLGLVKGCLDQEIQPKQMKSTLIFTF